MLLSREPLKTAIIDICNAESKASPDFVWIERGKKESKSPPSRAAKGA